MLAGRETTEIDGAGLGGGAKCRHDSIPGDLGSFHGNRSENRAPAPKSVGLGGKPST